ncbi:MAG: hypothetical protein NTV49_15500 [Kiritimatiellaeota bacterium]|nr:hypothetical protein [Kiritimatiellota bacterium]
MQPTDFEEALRSIREQDPRFDAEAYRFVREALDFTIKLLKKPGHGPKRHVSGGELLEGLRQYALQEYGPLAQTVLGAWGVRRGEDFGALVFNLVQAGMLGKTEEDRLEDFAGGYDFEQAFRAPFRPAGRPAARPRSAPG